MPHATSAARSRVPCNFSATELHVVCTSRLKGDLLTVLKESPDWTSIGPAGRKALIAELDGSNHLHIRENRSGMVGQHHGWWTLSNTNQELLRRCLYPLDWALYSLFCAGEEEGQVKSVVIPVASAAR